MDNNFSLPGISKIGMFNAEDMAPQVLAMSMGDMPVPMLCDIIRIPFVGKPTFNVSSKAENNGSSKTVALKFDTVAAIRCHGNTGFVVATPDGRTYLVASAFHPVPVVTYERDTGSPDGEASVYHYQVSLVTVAQSFECIANF